MKDTKRVETAFKPRNACSQRARFAFSKCPFCIKAKKELDDMGVPYKALDLDQMDQEAHQSLGLEGFFFHIENGRIPYSLKRMGI